MTGPEWAGTHRVLAGKVWSCGYSTDAMEKRAIRRRCVRDVVVPTSGAIQATPSVTLEDKVVHAVQLMTENNLKCIAVVGNRRIIGMVRLEDALRFLGLNTSTGGPTQPGPPSSGLSTGKRR